MLSLRVDNSRLNQLVSRGHVAPPAENSTPETSSVAESTNQPLQPRSPAGDKKHASALEDLSFPAAKSLSMNVSLSLIQ